MDTCFQGQSSATVFKVTFYLFLHFSISMYLNINALVVVERILQDSISLSV